MRISLEKSGTPALGFLPVWTMSEGKVFDFCRILARHHIGCLLGCKHSVRSFGVVVACSPGFGCLSISSGLRSLTFPTNSGGDSLKLWC